MQYIETKIFTSSQGTEPVMAMLLSHGIENITVDDPRDVRELIISKDEHEWDYIDPSLIEGEDEAVIFFYTEDSDSGKKLLESVKIDVMKLKSDEMYGLFGEGTDFGRMYAESSPLDDSWKDLWKKGILPFEITENIVIKPTWEEYAQKNDELVIEIDPGMAFGTGSHETTKSCAKLLAKHIKEGDEVLDIGTGSGILAIISANLGAESVDAIDIDPVAGDVAKANLEINNIKNIVKVSQNDILDSEIDGKYDIIVSNLTSGIIIKMLSSVVNLLKEGGMLILSGMLVEEKSKMNEHFADLDLCVEEVIADGEWYTVLLNK